jgi:hypothetical protein
MPKTNATMQSWRVFHYARKYLGRQRLYAIFGTRHARTIDGWCEDPRYTDKDVDAFDPIKGIRNLLWLLDDEGHVGVVRSALQYIASGTSIDCGDDMASMAEPPTTINAGILAVYKAVAELQAAIDAGVRPDNLKGLKVAILAEINLVCAKYRGECER